MSDHYVFIGVPPCQESSPKQDYMESQPRSHGHGNEVDGKRWCRTCVPQLKSVKNKRKGSPHPVAPPSEKKKKSIKIWKEGRERNKPSRPDAKNSVIPRKTVFPAKSRDAEQTGNERESNVAMSARAPSLERIYKLILVPKIRQIRHLWYQFLFETFFFRLVGFG